MWQEDILIEKKDQNYIEAIVNHYHILKGSINQDELQALYSSVYPYSRIKVNKEDWAICNLAVENNYSKRVCDQLEVINNRIDINKISSLETSEIFLNRLIKELQPYHKEIYGTIEPFCDIKERGLMLTLYNQLNKDVMYLWCCEIEEKKDLMIIISKDKTPQNLYMNDDKTSAEYFSKFNFDEAINYSLNQVDKFLDKNLNIKI